MSDMNTFKDLYKFLQQYERHNIITWLEDKWVGKDKQESLLRLFTGLGLIEKLNTYHMCKGNFNKNSDIDVLVLGVKKFPEHLCPVKIHLITLTKKQFETALRKKETLINEIISNYIIVNGGDYFVNIL